MIRRDMVEVLDIERDSFPIPWGEDEFILCLRNRNCIGMVAEINDRVVGYMIYEFAKTKLQVLNFAIAPSHRLQGVGRKMLERLVMKLNPHRQARILLEVRETNLDAQLFFKACGFRAVSVVRDFYEDVTEDAYVFTFKVKAESKECAGR